MSRNPLQTCPFDGTRGTPGAETRPAGKPAGGFRRQSDTGNVFGKKFQWERKTAPEPPRKSFCTGISPSEPRKKNSGARNFAFRPRIFSPDHSKKQIILTKPCTDAPFCAKKSRKNLPFGPDCAKVVSRKSVKTEQFVCFRRHFMTFCFWTAEIWRGTVSCFPAVTLRQICNHRWLKDLPKAVKPSNDA